MRGGYYIKWIIIFFLPGSQTCSLRSSFLLYSSCPCFFRRRTSRVIIFIVLFLLFFLLSILLFVYLHGRCGLLFSIYFLSPHLVFPLFFCFSSLLPFPLSCFLRIVSSVFSLSSSSYFHSSSSSSAWSSPSIFLSLNREQIISDFFLLFLLEFQSIERRQIPLSRNYCKVGSRYLYWGKNALNAICVKRFGSRVKKT